MKIYKCDSCGIEIENPFKVKMKEFYIGCEYDSLGVLPCRSKRRIKIHLCDQCFNNLKNLANNKK